MYKFYIIFFISQIIFFLQPVNIENYEQEKISWGNTYTIKERSEMTISPDEEVSFYDLKYGDIVVCDTNYEKESRYVENNKAFCWFIFDPERQPLSGWIDVENLIEYKGGVK